MDLGCVMENMWLMAHSLGIGFHVVSALSTNPVEKEVKNLLNIPENLKIAFASRLGYPVSTPTKYLRVRRDIKEFTHYNRFDTRVLNEKVPRISQSLASNVTRVHQIVRRYEEVIWLETCLYTLQHSFAIHMVRKLR